MVVFTAVMLNETGQKFHANVEAANRSEAYEDLQFDFPKAVVVQLKRCCEFPTQENFMHDF